jgi:glycine oxidase
VASICGAKAVARSESEHQLKSVDLQRRDITVVGAGITGLWQALTLSRRGHRVRLIERSEIPFVESASRWAGAMLAPDCEAEAALPVVRELGLAGLPIWQAVYPGVATRGSLVVAGARDRGEINRFAQMTNAHTEVDGIRLAELEPDLAGRFSNALFYPHEAHLATPLALDFLLGEAQRAGTTVTFGLTWGSAKGGAETVIDCRGLGARQELSGLRGVRGERIVVRSHEVRLSRPVRLLHPRHSLYVVPWGDARHMIGATLIESEDDGPMTVRSALELLGLAYALHPAFGEAEILDMGAGVRPAFADNTPKIIVRGASIHVNGLHRHGFLLAPVLAMLVADFLESGRIDPRVMTVERDS